MTSSIRFPYSAYDDDPFSPMPRLSLYLHHGLRVVEVIGLLDTGATINVLPFSVGETLGFTWDEQPPLPPLSGNLGRVEARGILVLASHPLLTPSTTIQLAFAWSRADDVPLVFGQTNFFMAFDVCFFRAEAVFEIRPK
ncbi:MAG: hypothetical protein K8L91_30180 [Anaerolineae bacterium]|nr:hypothetical protein [Anaerolineae bacterium]